MLFYKLLDQFLIYFHLVIVFINTFGWITRKTRKTHLIIFSLTSFSWFGLGFFFGIGYCPLTDWHWSIRKKLGFTDMPDSYIKFIIDYVFGTNLNAQLVNQVIFYAYFTILALTILVNGYDFYKRRVSN